MRGNVCHPSTSNFTSINAYDIRKLRLPTFVREHEVLLRQ